MPNLFMVMLGGRHAKANTEVHDVVMAIGHDLQEIIPQLKQAWFGESKGLHIDAWAQFSGVQSEGIDYQIQFSDAAPSATDQKLYLINLGGYSSEVFGELHRYHLVVAPDAMTAKQFAKQLIKQAWHKPHIDRIMDVDDCIPIDHIAGRYIHLVQGEFNPTIWENTYLTLA
ncbi:DUF1543 domain-containing protein [Acinetobacter beijerinckii]|uniref:DUF1543 domain-containing protein n=1 Tax=Acinetobacter beijerinckii CIP 110307 TaxID=1217648 RepID=N9FKX4_9GAMM|nr:DUF1543 domain-containing protein [Acinetobacter beijerinckii]ENW05551.1 hypothetical protein F933_02452 [Acinetobacter beijerinckii CIP 110307]